MSTEGSLPDRNATSTERIDLLLKQLREEISNLTGKENSHASRVESLENDLNAYKSLCSEYRAEKDKYQQLYRNLEKEKGDLENSIKGHRIVALLDGDGVLFETGLILGGRFGGLEAAQVLSIEITNYLDATFGARPYQLWVKIFLNRRGLVDAYQRFANVKDNNVEKKFEEFMFGFNQSTERFSIVDVGAIKEAADAKIKVHLEDDLRIPQTEKVIFGGCHDTGYINSLRSHITAGFKDKLVLLPGYTDMAFGIGDLGLPTMPLLPHLFLSQKLGPGTASNGGIPIPQTPRKNRGGSGLSTSPAVSNKGTPRNPPVALDPGVNGGKGANSNNNNNDEMRLLDPNLSLAKQDPPPCTRHYVSGFCKYGHKCVFGHNYILNETHLEEIRKKAKNTACDSIVKRQPCTYGEYCLYGHTCPAGAKCFYLKKKTCRFGGVAGHGLPEY